MSENIIIDDIPLNTCITCEKPFLHRKRYNSYGNTELKEVELIVEHPTCSSYNKQLNNLINEIYCLDVERKGHSKEVRALNKKMKEVRQRITDVEFKMFLKKYS